MHLVEATAVDLLMTNHERRKISFAYKDRNYDAEEIIITATKNQPLSEFETEIQSLRQYSKTSVIISDQLLNDTEYRGVYLRGLATIVISRDTYIELANGNYSRIFDHEAEHARSFHAAVNGSSKALVETSTLIMPMLDEYQSCSFNEIQARFVELALMNREIQKLSANGLALDLTSGDLQTTEAWQKSLLLKIQYLDTLSEAQDLLERFEDLVTAISEETRSILELAMKPTNEWFSQTTPNHPPKVSLTLVNDHFYGILDLNLPPKITEFADQPKIIEEIILYQMDLLVQQISQQSEVLSKLEE